MRGVDVLHRGLLFDAIAAATPLPGENHVLRLHASEEYATWLADMQTGTSRLVASVRFGRSTRYGIWYGSTATCTSPSFCASPSRWPRARHCASHVVRAHTDGVGLQESGLQIGLRHDEAAHHAARFANVKLTGQFPYRRIRPSPAPTVTSLCNGCGTRGSCARNQKNLACRLRAPAE